jgi:hypothetical protein
VLLTCALPRVGIGQALFGIKRALRWPADMASCTSSSSDSNSRSPPLSRRDTQATKTTTGENKKSLSGHIKAIWQKTGLDQPTILLMLKYDAAHHREPRIMLIVHVGAVFHRQLRYPCKRPSPTLSNAADSGTATNQRTLPMSIQL